MLTIFMGLLILTVEAGGPWAAGKKKGFAEISASYGLSSWLDDVTLQFYGEYGLTQYLTAKVIIPSKYVSSTRDSEMEFTPPAGSGSLFGVSNIVFGLKYQFLHKKIAMGAGMDVWARTLATDDDRGLRTGYEKWMIKPSLAIGDGYQNGYWFVEAFGEIATHDFSEQLGAVMEGGYKAHESMYISLFAQFVKSLENGSFNEQDAMAYEFTGLFLDEENYLSIGPKLLVDIKNGWGVNVGAFRDFNFIDGSGMLTLKLGIYYKS